MKTLVSHFRGILKPTSLLLAGCLAFFAAPASAAIVFQDNFDAEGPGSILSYSAFSNWNVSAGDVDIIAHLGFSIGCAGGAGSCVDMDGTTGQAGTLTSLAAIGPGSYIFSFDISGNQRRDPPDALTVTFGDLNEAFTLSAADPFQTITRNVTVGAGGSNIVFAHGNVGQDQLGIILDNVLVQTSETVSIHAPGALAFLAFGVFVLARRRA